MLKKKLPLKPTFSLFGAGKKGYPVLGLVSASNSVNPSPLLSINNALQSGEGSWNHPNLEAGHQEGRRPLHLK